jgi:DNA polymerase III subunit delta
MIIKSYELKKKTDLLKNNFFLLYGENSGLKKDIRELIKLQVTQKDEKVEFISLYENEIIDNEDNFYNFAYSGSLFSSTKLITIYEATDKIIKKIEDVLEKKPENTYFLIFSEILDKKSKLRNLFEKGKNTICIACYLDNERDLETITQIELKKKNIVLSRESINLLIQKSNLDRNNLRNELEKIKAYSLTNNKIDFEEVKSLINFSGDYKSDVLINECLSGNISQYKKMISEVYESTINHIFLLRILSNKIHRLLKLKEQESYLTNIDKIINESKPPIFWKEKPLIKKQLSIWKLKELRNIAGEINNIEILCKKNPTVSNSIFFNFFMKICVKN